MDELKKEESNEKIIFKVVPNSKYSLTSYEQAKGTLVDYFDATRIVSSDFIKFEKLLDDSIKIINNGVQDFKVKNRDDANVRLYVIGDNNNPVLSAGIVPENLINQLNLVTSAKINGNVISAQNGQLNLGNYLGSVANVYSSDSTVEVVATGQERVITVKPIRVNNVSIKPTKGFPAVSDNGVLLNLIDTNTVKIKNYQNDNPSENPKNAKVGFEAVGFIRSINNQEPNSDGNLTISGIGGDVFFSGDKVLTAEEATIITTTGYDLTNTPTAGNTIPVGTNLVNYVTRLFKNGLLLPFSAYTITDNRIRLTGTVAANEILSWIIQKV